MAVVDPGEGGTAKYTVRVDMEMVDAGEDVQLNILSGLTWHWRIQGRYT